MLGVAFQAETMADFITGPGEAAHLEFPIGIGELEACFQFSLLQKAFDLRVSIEKNGALSGVLFWRRGSLGLFRKMGERQQDERGCEEGSTKRGRFEEGGLEHSEGRCFKEFYAFRRVVSF